MVRVHKLKGTWKGILVEYNGVDWFKLFGIHIVDIKGVVRSFLLSTQL